MTTPIPDYQQRVVDECKQNRTRMTALNKMIDSNPIFKTLDEEEQFDMRQQSDIMHDLDLVLTRRLLRWGISVE